jgi:hypothetical protein
MQLISNKISHTQTLNIDYYVFQIINKITFLVTVNSSNTISNETTHRMLLGNKRCFTLTNVLKSQNVSRGTTCKSYKTVKRPPVYYRAKMLAVNKAEEKTPMTFERKTSWKIMGPPIEDNQLRIRTNVNLNNYTNASTFVPLLNFSVLDGWTIYSG